MPPVPCPPQGLDLTRQAAVLNERPNSRYRDWHRPVVWQLLAEHAQHGPVPVHLKAPAPHQMTPHAKACTAWAQACAVTRQITKDLRRPTHLENEVLFTQFDVLERGE